MMDYCLPPMKMRQVQTVTCMAKTKEVKSMLVLIKQLDSLRLTDYSDTFAAWSSVGLTYFVVMCTSACEGPEKASREMALPLARKGS
jgi:hypothetical protein